MPTGQGQILLPVAVFGESRGVEHFSILGALDFKLNAKILLVTLTTPARCSVSTPGPSHPTLVKRHPSFTASQMYEMLLFGTNLFFKPLVTCAWGSIKPRQP